ncbi:DUF262 domain-containing protein [Paenibacillus sp. MBLB2552]|uniref:DUF262 domain-containing protein n=1 Tax=Paenibacillus mellifer TaxID=2937794 RepID=A0A9X1XZB4_9BACL|nr:DUF262 domain-containing protein [Paenibacillus mellifer]MCK8486686.1 DUF262 domain-containing protein [Paenibacillus mellifer]
MIMVKEISFELEDTETVIHKYKFEASDNDDQIFIDSQGIEIMISGKNGSLCHSVKVISGESILDEHLDYLCDLFIDNYNKQINDNNETNEQGVEIEKELIKKNDPDILVPYDPNTIRVTQARFSLREIFEMINGTEHDESILDLSPDFQRNYVWDSTRKSRLIESILLKIPLPVFYLARNNEGKYQVVDGVQRLSVINQYFSNGFSLRNLEYLKNECDKKFFQKDPKVSLHPKFVRQLRSYQIDCNIIEPDTPHRVKSDIFKRLNTGGRSLNSQEIRNSILRKDSRDFIRKLAKSPEFVTATNRSINVKRMMDQELVTRYIGFYFLYKDIGITNKLKYNGIMDEFLDNVVEVLNSDYKKIPFNQLEADFKKSMSNAYILFKDYAFRKVKLDYSKFPKNMVNKSLFTAFSVLLSNFSSDEVKNKGILITEFAKYLEDNEYLYDSITNGTNDKARIDTTFLLIDQFLISNIGGKNDK